LTFVVRVFVNDTIAITVWTSFYFHVTARAGGSYPCLLLLTPGTDWQSYQGGSMWRRLLGHRHRVPSRTHKQTAVLSSALMFTSLCNLTSDARCSRIERGTR
jgi:hypothetical protein